MTAIHFVSQIIEFFPPKSLLLHSWLYSRAPKWHDDWCEYGFNILIALPKRSESWTESSFTQKLTSLVCLKSYPLHSNISQTVLYSAALQEPSCKRSKQTNFLSVVESLPVLVFYSGRVKYQQTRVIHFGLSQPFFQRKAHKALWSYPSFFLVTARLLKMEKKNSLS